MTGTCLSGTSVPPLHSCTVKTCSSADASVRTQLRRCDRETKRVSTPSQKTRITLKYPQESIPARVFCINVTHMIIFCLSQSSHLQDGVTGSDLVVQQGDVLTLFDVCTMSAQENIISDGC